MNLFRAAALLCWLLSAAFGQRLDPVQWSLSPSAPAAAPGSRVSVRLTARIEPGWHLYSLTTPKGPIPTTVGLPDNPAVSRWEVYQPKPTISFDPNFQLETETFENEAVFVVAFELAKEAASGPVELAVQVRYQACDDKQCLLPVRKTVAATVRVDPAAAPVEGC